MDGLMSETPKNTQTSNIADCIDVIADKIHRRSLVIIFTDMFQQTNSIKRIYEALQHLKHNKHEVLLFHVAEHETEKNFNFKDRPYKFIDSETGESITLTPSGIKEKYENKMESFYNEVKLNCGKLGIDFIEANTNITFDKILGAYLIKRKKMV